jgi:hypothetical protein
MIETYKRGRDIYMNLSMFIPMLSLLVKRVEGRK